MQVTDDGMGKPGGALSILAGKVLPEPLIKVVREKLTSPHVRLYPSRRSQCWSEGDVPPLSAKSMSASSIPTVRNRLGRLGRVCGMDLSAIQGAVSLRLAFPS